jgi:DNA-binding NarL/FixJ family response regulator
MKKTRIVIADDHTLIAQAWAFLLGQNPAYEVVKTYNNTEDLLNELEAVSPDIVVLDINIRPYTGLEAVPLLKAKKPGVIVIGISMHNEIAYAKRMIENGALAYVTKNSHQDEMFKAIDQALSGKTYFCEEIQRKMIP